MGYLDYIPATFREKIVQFLIGKFGRYVVSLIALGIATGITKLAEAVPGAAQQLAQIDQATLVAAVWGVLVSGIQWVVTHYLTKDAVAVQEALVKLGADLDVDGWVGDQTVKAIEKQGIEVRKAIEITPEEAAFNDAVNRTYQRLLQIENADDRRAALIANDRRAALIAIEDAALYKAVVDKLNARGT